MRERPKAFAPCAVITGFFKLRHLGLRADHAPINERQQEPNIVESTTH